VCGPRKRSALCASTRTLISRWGLPGKILVVAEEDKNSTRMRLDRWANGHVDRGYIRLRVLPTREYFIAIGDDAPLHTNQLSCGGLADAALAAAREIDPDVWAAYEGRARIIGGQRGISRMITRLRDILLGRVKDLPNLDMESRDADEGVKSTTSEPTRECLVFGSRMTPKEIAVVVGQHLEKRVRFTQTRNGDPSAPYYASGDASADEVRRAILELRASSIIHDSRDERRIRERMAQRADDNSTEIGF